MVEVMKGQGSVPEPARKYRVTRIAIRLWCLLAIVVCFVECSRRETSARVTAADLHVRHVVVIVQENRSFDNMFHGFPGADTVRYGRTHDGRSVPLTPSDFNTPYDIDHGLADFVRDFDHGRLDGFDLERVGDVPGAYSPSKRFGRYPQYRYVRPDLLQPYWIMARRFGLADHMFQSNLEQSFAAHLFLIAGTSGGAVNVPAGRPWGCDADPAFARVQVIDHHRHATKSVFPCFGFRTLGDELDAKNLDWRYYAPRVASTAEWRKYSLALHRNPRTAHTVPHPDFGSLWSPYDAIDHIRYGPDWTSNVVSPQTTVLSDIRAHRLPPVSWVIPDFKDSDHSLSKSRSGPDWVATIVNEIGTSQYWSDTIVFVTWDDSGGWYDHVRPPQSSYDGLGSRVPLIVIGARIRPGLVSHRTYEFGSILKFVEAVFSLQPLSDSDRRANDLLDFFDPKSPPSPYRVVPTHADAADFLRQHASDRPPDDD